MSDLEPVGLGTPAGRYLRRFWHPVLRCKDLQAGRAKPIELLSEQFTAYRGNDGVARVTGFRCPHRGTQLSAGWVEGDSLRCRYHGWRFDDSGQCVEQPNEEKPFCEKIQLPTYQTREYAELIFIYIGEGEPPPFQQYPDMDMPGVIVADPPEYLPCSFWNKQENDAGHIPWVHRATAKREGWSHYLEPRCEDVEETDYGFKATRKAGNNSVDVDAGPRRAAYFYMPYTRQFWQLTRAQGYDGRNIWDTKIVFTVPVNDQKFVSFDVTCTPLLGMEGRAYAEARYSQQEADDKTRWNIAEKIIAGEMAIEDLPNDIQANTCFEIEDYVTQVGQGTVAGRPQEHLGPTDNRVALLRRLWIREVTAMIDGKPMKNWKIPEESMVPGIVDSVS
jgi:5,5'-dehydrodivanillate O-demethylase